MTPEQQEYYDKELAVIKRGGNCKHDAFVVDCIWGMGSPNLGQVEPAAVGFSNNSDSYYAEYFNNWDEVNAFIDQIKKTAVEAWGEQENPAKKIEDLDEDWDRDLVEEENFDPITGCVNAYMYVDGE